MKTIKHNGLKAQVKQIKRDGSLFSFEVFAYSMEDDSASCVASGKIICDGACDFRIEHGSLSREMQDKIDSALFEV